MVAFFQISLVLTFFWCGQAFASVAIVTDLDDTLKRTNVQEPEEALYNALFTQKVFTGMDTLFKTMSSANLYVLTASPKIFMFNIEKLMRKRDLAPVDIFARGRNDFGDKERYKLDKIIEVADKGYEQLVLLGDDVEADPDIYERFLLARPEKVAAVYIHKVRGVELPENVVGYYTAYEVALWEAKAGRLTVEEAYAIGEEILRGDLKDAFPEFVVCPKDASLLNLQQLAGLEELSKRLGKRVANYCRNRDK